MGLTASKKAYQLVKNVVQMIAIEFYTAYQALGFKEGLKNYSKVVQEIYEMIRKEIPPLKEDKFFDEEVKWISERIENQVFTEMVKDKMGFIFGDN